MDGPAVRPVSPPEPARDVSTNENSAPDSGSFATLLQIVTQADSQNYMSHVLGSLAPLLDPVGAPIAVAAGQTLDTTSAGSVSESKTDDGRGLMASLESNPLLCRAIVAEAALQTVLKIDSVDSSEAAELGLFDKMREIYLKGHKDLDRDRLPPASSAATAAVSQSDLAGCIEKFLRESERDWFSRFSRAPETTSQSTHNDATPEIKDFMNNVVQIGTSIPPPSHSAITNLFTAAAAADDTSSTPSRPDDETASKQHVLAQRALLGDAALQTLQAVPPDVLSERGFFREWWTIMTGKKI